MSKLKLVLSKNMLKLQFNFCIEIEHDQLVYSNFPRHVLVPQRQKSSFPSTLPTSYP